jgi:hypothetical protein
MLAESGVDPTLVDQFPFGKAYRQLPTTERSTATVGACI